MCYQFLCAVVFLILFAPSISHAQLNPIQVENSIIGDDGWQLTTPAIGREIEGYADLTSVSHGSRINFFVSKIETNTDSSFQIDIYRTGYYGGKGARLVKSDTRTLVHQNTPVPDTANNGLVACQWSPSYTIDPVPDGWTTGVYLARLTAQPSGYQSYIIFVVRDDERSFAKADLVADLVYELSVTTYQAYNFWPRTTTAGNSLYNWAPGGQVVKVSFDRPYTLGWSYGSDGRLGIDGAQWGLGAGEYLTNLQPGPNPNYNPPTDSSRGYLIHSAGFEYNTVRWLEQNGYDVTYITDIDHHQNASFLNDHAAYLSVGHNEYWSMAMRTNLVNAFASGMNAAFFSSNSMYWQVRFEPGSDGSPDRTMVCYKGRADPDEPNPPLRTTTWRNDNLPEAALIGVEYFGDPVSDLIPNYTDQILIDNSNYSHFLLTNTGLSGGASLPGLLGYEVDVQVPGVSPDTTVALTSSPTYTLNTDFSNPPDNPPGFACDASVCNSNATWYFGPQHGY